MNTAALNIELNAHRTAGHRSAGEHALVGSSRQLASTELLKGQKVVEIAHNGAIYRLQATKLGKLILTK